LFSGTFFPVSRYPDLIRPVVELTPLYHSASLLRALTTGQVTAGQLIDVAYLIVMFVLCSALTIRLMRRRLIS
jgi:lipooligosaccharide transport system permease protein